MQSDQIHKNLLRWFLPVAVVVLSILLLQIIFSPKYTSIQEITPKDGILDIRNVDIESNVFNINNNWDFYPAALYTSEDFASGHVGEKAKDDVSSSDVSYATHRLRILAQPNQYFTICGFSLDYASRVFVNGTEVVTFGNVADNAADFVPQVGYMTIPMFSGESGEIEIIYQYGNYVHREGGYIQPTYFSTPQTMERFKAANDLVSLTVSGGLLLLMLYFLLSAVVRHKADFLCLSFLLLVNGAAGSKLLQHPLASGRYIMVHRLSHAYPHRDADACLHSSVAEIYVPQSNKELAVVDLFEYSRCGSHSHLHTAYTGYCHGFHGSLLCLDSISAVPDFRCDSVLRETAQITSGRYLSAIRVCCLFDRHAVRSPSDRA